MNTDNENSEAQDQEVTSSQYVEEPAAVQPEITDETEEHDGGTQPESALTPHSPLNDAEPSHEQLVDNTEALDVSTAEEVGIVSTDEKDSKEETLNDAAETSAQSSTADPIASRVALVDEESIASRFKDGPSVESEATGETPVKIHDESPATDSETERSRSSLETKGGQLLASADGLKESGSNEGIVDGDGDEAMVNTTDAFRIPSSEETSVAREVEQRQNVLRTVSSEERPSSLKEESSELTERRFPPHEILASDRIQKKSSPEGQVSLKSQESESSLNLQNIEAEQPITPSNLSGPTVNQYSYHERLAEIKAMERTLKERAAVAAIDILNQNVQTRGGSTQPRVSAVLAATSTSDDLASRIKQLDTKVKTINRRLQESKREKTQLEQRIQNLEYEIFTAHKEKLISSMLDHTPTEEDLIALERIKRSIKLRAERIKAIRETEQRTNALNRVLESAETILNSLPAVAKYKRDSCADADTVTSEVTRVRSHELAPATFPKPVDVITFESDADLTADRESSSELRRKKSVTSELKGSRDLESGRIQFLKRKSAPDSENGQGSGL